LGGEVQKEQQITGDAASHLSVGTVALDVLTGTARVPGLCQITWRIVLT